MEKVLLFILLFSPLLGVAQEKDSTEFAGQKNPWIEILGLSDDNVETVETAVTERISGGTTSKLFVFSKDGTVRHFSLFTPDGTSSNREKSVREREISESTQEYYKNLLKGSRGNNFDGIDAKQLNNTTDGQRIVKIKGGKTFRLRYIGYDYYKDFNTYSPKRYIQNRLPGWQERQKFLNLIAAYNKEVKW